MYMRDKTVYIFRFVVVLLLLFNACSFVVYAQQQNVKGRVLDAGNDPIPGVAILIKGTNRGTITDSNGYYSIQVNPDATLVYSFIGMKKKEEQITNRQVINVILEEDRKEIEEVQVVSYGTQKKVTITGAISEVKSDELVKSPGASLAGSLAGKVTGLSTIQVSGQPGADDPEIYIRGQGTFNDASPLFIVDGVERPFTQLDPREVESITVLKDASATAVYGIRGANGVIIVTTKRGSKGKSKISASFSMGIQQPTRLLKFADSYTYAMRYNEAQANDGLNKEDFKFQPHVVEAFKTNSDPFIFPNTNWLDYIMKNTAKQMRGNISTSGGTDKVKYFVLVGVFNQDGLFRTFDTDYDYNFSYVRYNYRSNIDIKVTNSTKLAITAGGKVGVRNQPNTQDGMQFLFRNIYWSVPYAGPGIVDDKWIKTNEVYIPGNKKEGLTPFYGRGYNNSLNHALNLDIDLKQDLSMITKGLNFKIKFAYNTTYIHTKYRRSTKTHYEPFYEAHLNPDSPLYLQFNQMPDDKTVALRRIGEDGNLSYGEGMSKARNWYTDFGFNYKRNLGFHHIGGLLLYNQRKVYYPASYSDIPTGVIGLVGRVTYDYRTKYMVEFNMGYNGSENFARENRYGWFPAGSIGWILTEEPFLDSTSFLNYLKIRGSMGLVGNDKMGSRRFMYLQGPYNITTGGYNFGIDNPNNQTVASELAVGNPDVTWETALKSDVGIDAYFFNSKLKLTFDYFRENRKDILTIRQTVPDFLAYSLMPVNIGKTENKGYEIELKWKQQLGQLRYHINANVSHAKNKIIFMDEVPQPESYMQKTGYPIATPFGYMFDGFFTQKDIDSGNYPDHLFNPSPGDIKYKDLNDDGIVDVNDIAALGYSRFPEFSFGSNIGFNFKGFDFSMFWSGAAHVTRMLSEIYRISFGPTNDRALLEYMANERWTPENASTAKYPRLTLANSQHNTKGSDFWLKDATYLRLKNIQLGYNFKGRFLSDLGVKNLRVYANGYNLLTFDKLEITDPESNTADDSRYPLMKIYNFGVKVDF